MVVPAIGAHHLGQAGPTSSDPGSHRSRWDPQDLLDLGVVAAGDVPQHDRRTELLRQPGQGRVEVETHGDRGRIIGTGGRSQAVVGVCCRRHRAAAPSTKLVEGRVGGYPVGPGRELGLATEAGESPDDGDEGFLGGVLAVGVIAGESSADGVDPVVVPPQQLVERTPVPGLGSLGESGVVEIVANLGSPLGVQAAGIW